MARDQNQRDAKESEEEYTKLPLPKKLPKSLQETLDSDEKMWSTMVEGKASDSTESDVRYAAYAARVRTILRSATRYVAYTSDIGESFRPVAHPWLVRGAYGISWAYLIGDVGNEGRKAYVRNQEVLNGSKDNFGTASLTSKDAQALQAASPEPAQAAASISSAITKDLAQSTPAAIAPLDDYRTVMVQRAIFQGVASMGLPAFTIHSIVKYTGRAMKNVANKSVRTWTPIGLGLAAVPALPFMFDEPVEKAVEYIFHKGFEMAGQGHHPSESKKEL